MCVVRCDRVWVRVLFADMRLCACGRDGLLEVMDAVRAVRVVSRVESDWRSGAFMVSFFFFNRLAFGFEQRVCFRGSWWCFVMMFFGFIGIPGEDGGDGDGGLGSQGVISCSK